MLAMRGNATRQLALPALPISIVSITKVEISIARLLLPALPHNREENVVSKLQAICFPVTTNKYRVIFVFFN
jgi:hypothetical protein